MNTRKTFSLFHLPVTLFLSLFLNGCFLARQLAPAEPVGGPKSGNPDPMYGPDPGGPPNPSSYPVPTPGPNPNPNTGSLPTPELLSSERLRRGITDYAGQFIGTKYTAAGKNPSTGFDCSGFTNYVLSAYGYPLAASARQQAQQGQEVPLLNARPGDLIFYQRNPRDGIFHVSVVVENTGTGLWVIHSTTSRGVIRENILASTYWKPFIYTVRDVLSGR
jgi:hypothetical protein